MALDDQIGELQKQIEELTGGESKGLNKIIFDLHLKIDTNKDKIADAESKDLEDKQEVKELSENLESAQIALQEFVNTLDTAKADLASSEISLKEAQQEELAVQAIIESSGDESAKLSQQLTRLLNELNAATEVLAEAQNEVNKTAVQAELISEQLAKSQDAAEENRLALGELELQGEELTGDDSGLDRNKLSKDLIAAQRSEEKIS